MKVQFKIVITEDYHLKCSTINDQDIETSIQLPSDNRVEYVPNILFHINTIFICPNEVNGNEINFMKEWIENPQEFHKHTIHFLNKEYQVISEVLFALVILDFKKVIQKDYIIEDTIVKIPSDSLIISERIKISLESIGLKNISINQIEYNYDQQGEYLEELIEKKETIEKQKIMIKRAKEINPSVKEKLDQIDMNDENIVEYDNFDLELSKKFSTNEITKMKLCQLDNYCIFIASRYFETLQDHINLTFVCKRMRGNMEKFHYNPISLNEQSVKLFPNIETLHIYEEDDDYLEGGRIQRYVEWNFRIAYYLRKIVKIKNKENEIEFKRLVWTKDDTKEEFDKQKPNDSEYYDYDWEFKLTIPEGVKELDVGCFDNYSNDLKELIIPKTVKIIPKDCIKECCYLTNITLPLNQSQMLIVDKIFNIQSNLKQDIRLPNYTTIINGNEVKQIRSLQIPTTVTSIDEDCFGSFYLLEQLIIPETVKTISKNCIEKSWSLTNITLPLNNNQMIIGNKIFNTPHLEQHIYLLPRIQFINGKQVKQLTSFEIPTFVTSIDENCFYKCNELQQLIIPETVINIPFGTFVKLPNLIELIIRSNKYELNGDRLYYIENDCLDFIPLPSTIKKVNYQEIKPLKTFTIPSNVTKLSDFCFEKCEELTEIKGIENVKEIGIGCFLNCPKLNRKQYPTIKKNDAEYVDVLMKKEDKQQLEEWIGLKCSEILFDSKFDDWYENSSIFNEKIIGKKKLLFIIENGCNEKIGYYFNSKVIEQYNEFQKTNSKSFHFKSESDYYFSNKLNKFEIVDNKKGGIMLWKQSDEHLITLGNIVLKKFGYDDYSFYCRFDKNFNYYGTENELYEKNYFRPNRFLVIQME